MVVTMNLNYEEVIMMKGYLVIDDVSLDEAMRLLEFLKKKGRWISVSGMRKLDSAAGFAILSHGFSRPSSDEVIELDYREQVPS